LGLTDVIREALKANDEVPMSPTQIRDKLLQVGYDLSGYKNVQAAIHTTLTRLVKMGEILAVEDEVEGKGQGKFVWSRLLPYYRDPASDDMTERYKKGSDSKASRSKKKASKKGSKKPRKIEDDDIPY
jgi:hypothetical protein